jgi:hypothetical protein
MVSSVFSRFSFLKLGFPFDSQLLVFCSSSSRVSDGRAVVTGRQEDGPTLARAWRCCPATLPTRVNGAEIVGSGVA